MIRTIFAAALVAVASAARGGEGIPLSQNDPIVRIQRQNEAQQICLRDPSNKYAGYRWGIGGYR